MDFAGCRCKRSVRRSNYVVWAGRDRCCVIDISWRDRTATERATATEIRSPSHAGRRLLVRALQRRRLSPASQGPDQQRDWTFQDEALGRTRRTLDALIVPLRRRVRTLARSRAAACAGRLGRSRARFADDAGRSAQRAIPDLEEVESASRMIRSLIDVKRFTKGTNGKTSDGRRNGLEVCWRLHGRARPTFFEYFQYHKMRGTPVALKIFSFC